LALIRGLEGGGLKEEGSGRKNVQLKEWGHIRGKGEEISETYPEKKSRVVVEM